MRESAADISNRKTPFIVMHYAKNFPVFENNQFIFHYAFLLPNQANAVSKKHVSIHHILTISFSVVIPLAAPLTGYR